MTVNGTSGAPEGGITSTSGDVVKSQEGDNQNAKLLKELNNYRQKCHALEAEKVSALEKAEQEKKRLEENSLVEKEEFKKLAETYKVQLDEINGKYQNLNETVISAKKQAVLSTELLKLGINKDYLPQALKISNMDDIKFDTEYNKSIGADAVAQTIKETVPVLFGGSGQVASTAPEGRTEKLTLEAYKKLPYDERLKRREELENNLGIKTGLTRISSSTI